MPPRRKSKVKKLASQSKTPVVESATIVDDRSIVSVDFNETDQESAQPEGDRRRREDESLITKIEEHEEDNVMKQEDEASNGNFGILDESLGCDDDEDRVPASSGVEFVVKVEVSEERSTEIVMEENVNCEDAVEIENGNDRDEDSNMDTLEGVKCGNAVEKTGVEEKEPIESGAVRNGSSEPGTGPVAEPNLHEENIAAESNEAEAHGDHNNNLDLLEEGITQKEDEGEESDGDDEGSDEEESGDDNKDPIIEGTNENNIEIFVGGLDKKVVEDDLIEVFGKFGEIKAARIVRKSNTNKSKGFAFIQYATLEQTKNALSKLKEGIEVKGKHVRVSTSQDKDALYIGNICGTWTKEQVLDKLKEYGIEDIVDIQLPDDQNKTKGCVLLKFSCHTNAIEAHKRLSMPDAIFGCDRSARVAFKHHVAPNDEALLQVKRVYIEGLTGDWNEEKLKEICKQYGEISEVKLIKGLGKKRKDFGFVSFTSRESALACVEGIDNALVGEDKIKVKAAIAKPQKNGRPQQHVFSGGFVVEGNKRTNSKKEGEKGKKNESSKEVKGNSNSKWEKRKGKAVVVADENKKFNKPRRVNESQTGGGERPKIENRDRKRKNQTSKGEGYHSRGREERDNYNRPPKRARENARGRQSNNYRNPKGDDRARNYQGHSQGPISASRRQSSDMEPHAGFLQPIGGKQVNPYSGYVDPHVRYLEAPHPHAGIQSQPYAGYREPPAVAYAPTQSRPHVIYHQQREPPTTVWTHQPGQTLHRGYHAQPHPAAYSQPAPVRHDGHVSSGSSYVAATSPLPPYVAKYSSHPGYEGHSSGGYYQSSGGGAYVPRRTYY